MEYPGLATIEAPMDARWLAVKNATIELPGECLPTIDGVHAFTRDHIRYQPDQVDEWSLPLETLTRRMGDCEDYCILERALLIAAGYPSDAIWMLIAFDKAMRRDHAMLVIDGCVLDCRSSLLIRLASLQDYRPIIAFCDDRAVTFGRAV